MLLEFSCSNHKSIRDTILFSTLASSDSTFSDRLGIVEDNKVLKSAVIYGANGSGKSNLISTIAFVKTLVMNSVNYQIGQGIGQQPNKLSGFEKESNYKIQFVTKGIRYAYHFSIKNMVVHDEYLYYFPNRRQTKIFERTGERFTAGSHFRGKFNSCKDVLKPNKLLLSCAASFSSVQQTIDAYRFFSEELVIYNPSSQENWMQYSLYQMNQNEKVKASVITFLQELGTGIKDIKVTIDQRRLEEAQLPPFLTNEFKNLLLQQKTDFISASVVYDGFETNLMTEESTGVRKLFAILCPLIDIMINGKVLICDELEAGLHESMVYGLVKLFVKTDTPQFAQLIFTTHETGLLNLDLFRRDQIWFTEMRTPDRSTDLYSLAEIRNVRKEDNFGRGYIAGKYGAIPMLNLNFADIVSHM